MLKILILINLILILISLGAGVVFLSRKEAKKRKHLLTSLTIRICLSFSLIGLLIFAYIQGDIKPNAIPVMIEAPLEQAQD